MTPRGTTPAARDCVDRRVPEGAYQPHLRLAREHHLEHLLRAPGADGERDARVVAAESFEQRGQHVGAHRRGGREREPAGRRSAALERAPRIGDGLQRTARMGQQ
jgi:hypothetical protein